MHSSSIMLKHTTRRSFSSSARTTAERPSNSLASVFRSPRVEMPKITKEEKAESKELLEASPKATQSAPSLKKSLATTGLLARIREIKQNNKNNIANAQNTMSKQLLSSLETTIIPEPVSKKPSVPPKPSQPVMTEDEKREMEAWRSAMTAAGGKWAKILQPAVEEPSTAATTTETETEKKNKKVPGTSTLEDRLKDRAQLVNAAKMPVPVQQMRVEAVDLESPFAIPSLRELMVKARVESEKNTTDNSTEVARQNAMEQYGGDYQRYLPNAIKQLTPEAATVLSRNVTYTLLQRQSLADAVHQLSSR